MAPEKPLGTITEGHGSSLITNYKVVRRNGKLAGFDKNKIAIAMTKAFLAVEGGQAAASTRVHETVEKLTDLVVETLTRRQPNGGTFHIEDIQDQVELAMMRNGDQKIARAYVLYREERTNARALERIEEPDSRDVDEIVDLSVKLKDGSTIPLDTSRLKTIISEAC
ncbi:MAG: ribonucleoside-diphosphate reductase subunit alpha, partial [Gammaproteobacteria bacterium]